MNWIFEDVRKDFDQNILGQLQSFLLLLLDYRWLAGRVIESEKPFLGISKPSVFGEKTLGRRIPFFPVRQRDSETPSCTVCITLWIIAGHSELNYSLGLTGNIVFRTRDLIVIICKIKTMKYLD